MDYPIANPKDLRFPHHSAQKMNLLLQLRKTLKKPTGLGLISYHKNDGGVVGELNKCVYIKISDYIFPRDSITSFRSKRGSGDVYPLDSVCFLLTHRDASYGEYMQEARRQGVGVISLVDKKDLLAYIDEEQRPDECASIDTATIHPTPLRSFNPEDIIADLVEDGDALAGSAASAFTGKVTTRPTRSREDSMMSTKDLTAVVEMAKEALRELNSEISGGQALHGEQEQRRHGDLKCKPVSLLDQIASINAPAGATSASAAAAVISIPSKRSSRQQVPGVPKKIPIIIIPAAPTATLTMYNVRDFLEKGKFIPSVEAKSLVKDKENSISIEHQFPGQSKPVKFQIIDNPSRIAPEEWSRVAAVFVQGNTWQFKGWKWESPLELFQNVCGFFLNLDEIAIPNPKIASWNVHHLAINKTRRHMDATASFQFWSQLESFLHSKRLI